MAIEPLSENSLSELARLMLKLWPECRYEEEYQNTAGLLHSEKEAVFLGRAKHGECIAFIQLSLRSDYVEGTTSSPVGYIEGIYVEPAYRGAGLARQLVEAGEAWCKKQGCTEIASDTEISNTSSQAFHEKQGFEEVNRLVCYRKYI